MEIQNYIDRQKRIEEAETLAADNMAASLRERWEFGKDMLTERVPASGKGTKAGVPKARMAELVDATGCSAGELSFRMQFAELCPTEVNFSHACEKYPTWYKLRNGGLAAIKAEQQGPKAKPRKKTEPKVKPKSPKREDPIVREEVARREAIGEEYSAPEVVESLAAKGITVGVETIKRIRSEIRNANESAPIDWESLPGNMKDKLARMRRQVGRELRLEFEPRVQREVQERMEFSRKRIDQMERECRRVLDARKGVFTKAEYKLIRSCLHPDSRLSVSNERLDKAFRLFNEADIVLMNEQHRPTTARALPDAFEDLTRQRKTKGAS